MNLLAALRKLLPGKHVAATAGPELVQRYCLCTHQPAEDDAILNYTASGQQAWLATQQRLAAIAGVPEYHP